MFFEQPKKGSLILLLSFLLLFIGSAYLVYLQVLFPRLVPGYGGGERFILSEANDFTLTIPWSAYTRLHVALEANDTVGLYMDGSYVCDCVRYEFVVEGGGDAIILLRSSSPVNGLFKAWQETPLGKQLSASLILLFGLVGVATSIITRRKKGSKSFG